MNRDRRTLTLQALLAAVVLLGLAASATAEGDDAERFARLTIEGVEYRAPIGEPFAVDFAGERVTLRIDLEEWQTFSDAGVSFRYPGDFVAERVNEADGVAVWTIQGKSAAVVLQRHDETIDPESLAEAIAATIVERYGERRVTRQAVKLRGVDRSYPGERLHIAAGDDRLARDSEQNLFAFANESGVFALIVQDSRPAGSGATTEFETVVRLLGESFEAGPPPEPDPEPGAEKPADP